MQGLILIPPLGLFSFYFDGGGPQISSFSLLCDKCTDVILIKVIIANDSVFPRRVCFV